MLACSASVERLLLAIQAHEGWHPAGSVGFPAGSRSWRNHNPGNLRSSPFAFSVVDGFAVFRSDAVGFMALHWDIMQKARGNTVTGLGPASTIAELIAAYAPPEDGNDVERYVSEVERMSGLPASTTLGSLFDR